LAINNEAKSNVGKNIFHHVIRSYAMINSTNDAFRGRIGPVVSIPGLESLGIGEINPYV
jgi:hypothetical protein